MRVTTLLNRTIGLAGLWVKGVRFEGEALVIEIARRFDLLTCPACGTKVRGRFEERTRSWRHLELWGRRTYLEGPIRRLRCPKCKAVRTEAVPWARPRSTFTRAFEDAVAMLAQKLNHTAVTELTGITWAAVGSIAERLIGEVLDEGRFEGLRRIGVDEISYRKRHRYLTVVVDHDRGTVVWAGEGKSGATLEAFFTLIGPERSRLIEIVSMDMSAAYIRTVRAHAPNAEIVFDRFHVARLANDAVDAVRRAEVRELEGERRSDIKGSRWPLLKRPTKLSDEDRRTLAWIAKANRRVYRAYLLKESFLDIFGEDDLDDAQERMTSWLAWASRSRLRPFVKLGRTVRRYRDDILRFIESRLSNARLEGMNNKIRLLSHRAFGFHSPAPLIATIYLCCSGLQWNQLQLT